MSIICYDTDNCTYETLTTSMWGYGFELQLYNWPQGSVTFYGPASYVDGFLVYTGIGGEHTFTIPCISGTPQAISFINDFGKWNVYGGASSSTSSMVFQFQLLDDQTNAVISTCTCSGGVLSGTVQTNNMSVTLTANRNCKLKIDITMYIQPA